MPTIYKLETICSRSKHFEPAVLKAARSQALAAKGKAMVVVHPFFTEYLSADESLERTHPVLFRQIAAKDFDAHVSRLGSVLKTTTMVPFVLGGENTYDRASGWLNGMMLNKHVYMAGTKSNNPTPLFSFGTNVLPWHYFARTMRDIGISNIFLAGEMAYFENNENLGCVFSTYRLLSLHFPVKILHHLTYPGIY